MEKTIILKKKENKNSILPVLKALNLYESKIISHEDLINVYEKYKDKGEIEIRFNEDYLVKITSLCDDLELKYLIS